MRTAALRIAFVFLACVAFQAVSLNTYAQPDQVETEDVVHLKDGTIVRGEIQSFDDASGTIIFKDHEGRKYTFTPDQYEYYLEDQLVQVRRRFGLPKTLHPRKNSGIDIQLGFTTGYMTTNHAFEADQYNLETYDYYDDAPISAHMGVGLQVDSVHAVSAIFDLAFFSYNSSMTSFGARYTNRYPGQKRNAAFYLPVEIKYTSIQSKMTYKVDEPDPDFQWERLERNYDMSVSALELALGQGVQWSLPNKRAISAEFVLYRHFNINPTFEGVPSGEPAPNSEFTVNGFRFGLFYHL